MKRPKCIVQEHDFGFAESLFSLTGERAIEVARAPKPYQAAPLELFLDAADHARDRAVLRGELEFAP